MNKSFYKVGLDTVIGFIDCLVQLSEFEFLLLQRNMHRGRLYYNTVNMQCLPNCHCDFCLHHVVESIEPINVNFELNECYVHWLVCNLIDIMTDAKNEGTSCYDYDLPVKEYDIIPDNTGVRIW
jgi:hypothetical protein